MIVLCSIIFFFFKQKTAYEMRISAWSSDVCSSDLDRVGRARGALPEEIEEPIIKKVEADARAIVYLAFSSDRHSPLEISDYADRYVQARLQSDRKRVVEGKGVSVRVVLSVSRMHKKTKTQNYTDITS